MELNKDLISSGKHTYTTYCFPPLFLLASCVCVWVSESVSMECIGLHTTWLKPQSLLRNQLFENMVHPPTTTPHPPPALSLSLCQIVGSSWEVLMEKLLLLFPLFTTLMWKAPSMLQLCVAMTRPPCHSPLVTQLMGRPQRRKTGFNRWIGWSGMCVCVCLGGCLEDHKKVIRFYLLIS